MRKIDKIIIHCADTPEGRHVTIEQINKWHIQRGFSSIGYHYVIYLDGSIHSGRPIEEIGAHCKGQNRYSIGICYVGGRMKTSKKAKDTRTIEQKGALIRLVKSLMTEYKLKATDVYGHCQFDAAKACPSFDIEDLRKHLVD